MAEDEEGASNNVFASLMPNLFSRLKHCDDTVSEQEFQEIHRLLNQAISKHDVSKENSSISQSFNEKSQEDVGRTADISKHDDKALKVVRNMPSPLIKSDYAAGKENALPENPSQRNKLSRRERSSRITTHKKPFMVDLRSFGSILNNNALGKCEKPQDVHAFWEAADEREASEAIMGKLRGRCEQKAANGTAGLRRLGVRRRNSQRTTTRLKRFAVELPSCAEQMQSLDQEQLEEEDVTESSSFTFLSNPEFRGLNHTLEQELAKKQIQGFQQSSPLQSNQKSVEISYMDGMSGQPEEDLDILSDGKSPLVNATDAIGLTDDTASKDSECKRQSQASEMVDMVHGEGPSTSRAASDQPRNVAEKNDAASESQMKATPYNRNEAAKRTPFTSPTPPSNPLAAFGLTKETVVEDMSKRRLDFDDTTEPQALDSELPAVVAQDTSCSQIPSTSPPSPKTLTEEGTLEVAEELVAEASTPLEALNSYEKVAMKPNKKSIVKRKRLVDNRRDSLEGAGTNWEKGQRRSTRIKSRPLEWWRGERFLRGRVHKSLVTVIGIKYSSPPPCWPKRGTKAPNFKVESYVADEYAKYVQFAALC